MAVIEERTSSNGDTSKTMYYSDGELGLKVVPETKSNYNKTNGLLETILGTNWSFSSMYSLDELSNAYVGSDISKGFIFDGTENKAVYVTNININPITNANIQEWIAGRYVYTTGRLEMKQLTLTFRCHDNMSLYNSMKIAHMRLKDLYPKEQMWNITISAIDNNLYNTFDGIGYNNISPFTEGQSVLNTSSALLVGISNITFDDNSKEIITFSATFMYSKENQ